MLYEGGHTNRSGRGKFPVTAHHTHSKIWLLQFQQNLMALQDPSEEDQESILQDPSVEGQEGFADQIICRLYV